jgi:hypothetical protein
MAQSIVNNAPPNLPLGTEGYERRYQDQLNNIIRLYFNQLNNTLNSLIAVVNTSSTVYTVNTLPDAAVAGLGTRTFVSDSSVTTFNANLVGGGTTTVPVYSDGTNWKVG